MRVLVAPDCFGATLSARAAAEAIAAGWASAAPDDALDLAPLADGGPGFLDVLGAGLPGARTIEVRTVDPFGQPVDAQLLLAPDATAYVESAQACGLHLVAPGRCEPEAASSAGLAALLSAAAGSGATRVVVGVGGTASTDAGAGMLAALAPGVLDRVELVLAADVDSPLTGPAGAARVFAPQKGADPAAVERLEARLVAAAAAAPALAARPGAGAGGGLGFALYQLGACARPGFEVVAEVLGLPDRLAQAGLVITGEGRVDASSLGTKVVGAVAALARRQGRTCLVLAGEVALGGAELRAWGISAAYSLVDHTGSRAVALADAAGALQSLAAQLAATMRQYRQEEPT